LAHLQQREEHWAIVDLVGKGGHVRTVPVPDWVRNELDEWLAAAAIDQGRLFRRVNKAGKTWGEGMTVKAVWHIVKEAANRVGVAKLAPHAICAELVLGSATPLEVSWNRFSSSWVTFRFRPPNAILAANREFGQRSMIESVSSRLREPYKGFGKGRRPLAQDRRVCSTLMKSENPAWCVRLQAIL
jgi:hypothetical protein